MYKVYSTDGYSVETDSPSQAVALLKARLDKYGYPKYHEWLDDLNWAIDQPTFATAGPWFYGHVGVEWVGEGTPEAYAPKPGLLDEFRQAENQL